MKVVLEREAENLELDYGCGREEGIFKKSLGIF